MAFEKLKIKISIWLINIITWPLAWLPHKVGLAFGAGIGRLFFRILSRRRRIAVDNIIMVQKAGGLPENIKPVELAREAFANLGRSGWEAIKIYHRGLDSMTPFCSIESGEEYLLAQSKSKKGIVFVTGHCGNWELMCHFLARSLSSKLHIVGRSLGFPLADELAKRLRHSDGNDFIFKTGGARNMLQVLRKGGVLGTLIDQAAIVDNEGLPVPFLGIPAMTNLGPLKLALHNKSQVMLVLFHRQGEKHLAKVYPPFDMRQDIDPADAVLEAATFLNHELSSFVQKYPDQWLWGHRRWKTPEGVAADPQSIT